MLKCQAPKPQNQISRLVQVVVPFYTKRNYIPPLIKQIKQKKQSLFIEKNVNKFKIGKSQDKDNKIKRLLMIQQIIQKQKMHLKQSLKQQKFKEQFDLQCLKQEIKSEKERHQKILLVVNQYINQKKNHIYSEYKHTCNKPFQEIKLKSKDTFRDIKYESVKGKFLNFHYEERIQKEFLKEINKLKHILSFKNLGKNHYLNQFRKFHVYLTSIDPDTEKQISSLIQSHQQIYNKLNKIIDYFHQQKLLCQTLKNASIKNENNQLQQNKQKSSFRNGSMIKKRITKPTMYSSRHTKFNSSESIDVIFQKLDTKKLINTQLTMNVIKTQIPNSQEQNIQQTLTQLNEKNQQNEKIQQKKVYVVHTENNNLKLITNVRQINNHTNQYLQKIHFKNPSRKSFHGQPQYNLNMASLQSLISSHSKKSLFLSSTTSPIIPHKKSIHQPSEKNDIRQIKKMKQRKSMNNHNLANNLKIGNNRQSVSFIKKKIHKFLRGKSSDSSEIEEEEMNPYSKQIKQRISHKFTWNEPQKIREKIYPIDSNQSIQGIRDNLSHFFNKHHNPIFQQYSSYYMGRQMKLFESKNRIQNIYNLNPYEIEKNNLEDMQWLHDLQFKQQINEAKLNYYKRASFSLNLEIMKKNKEQAYDFNEECSKEQQYRKKERQKQNQRLINFKQSENCIDQINQINLIQYELKNTSILL